MTSGELRVRLFAGLREQAGWQERSLVHQSGMTAAFGQLAGQIGLLITVIFVIRLLPKGMGHLFTRR
jgi:hypothetical protein